MIVMNKQEKNKERIEIIKEERYELLKEVRESINNGNDAVIENAESIIEALDYDEKNIKKYEALKEAQTLIESLTKEIANAKTKEEIETLRKKLNYYINKVKNEAKKRNIDYSEYYENVTNIRKNISKYIRFIKRRDQIEELEKINEKYYELDKESQKKLSHQISSARNYNTRIIKEKMMQNSVVLENNNLVQEELKRDIEVSPIELVSDSEDKNESMTDEREHHDVDFVLVGYKNENLNVDDLVEDQSDNKAVSIINNIDEEPTKAMIVLNRKKDNSERKKSLYFQIEDEYASDEEFVTAKVDEFGQRYKISEAYEYNNSIGKNMISFVKNIPIYNANKRKIKRMMCEYTLFHRSDDLGIYIEYIRKDNSIIEGLRKIFNKSSLYNRENEYLNNHERCVNWILSFVKENNIILNYRLAK